MKIFNNAYELDELLGSFDSNEILKNFDEKKESRASKKEVENLTNKLLSIKEMLQPLSPKKERYDEVWSFWIDLSVGSFHEYLKAVAAEEKVPEEELAEELKFEWEYQHPEEAKWYRLSCCSSYEGREFNLSFSDYFLIYDKKSGLRGYQHSLEQQQLLLEFIQSRLSQIINEILNDKSYSQKLENKLSKRYRFGRIKRSDLWDNLKNIKRLDQELGKANIEKLITTVTELKRGKLLDKMTANDFFNYCAIGYDANDYSLSENMSAIDKYR